MNRPAAIALAIAVAMSMLLVVACSGPSLSSAGQSQSNLAGQATPSAGSPTPGVATIPTPPAVSGTPAPGGPRGPGYGPGMGPGRGPGGGMGPGYGPGMGPGMRGGGYGPGGTPYNANGSPVTMDQAVTIANQYLASTGYTNLETAHIHEFTNGFEAEYVEKGSDTHAFEILIDKYSGAAFLEMGPNVMWNTKYSPMGSGMGRPTVAATTKMPVSAQTARSNAQAWLTNNLSGATLGSDVDTTYGYYEMEVDQGGKASGEIDVNGYTGQVWYENWHGPMVQSRELTPSRPEAQPTPTPAARGGRA